VLSVLAILKARPVSPSSHAIVVVSSVIHAICHHEL
jgi:hypothetical protein